MKSIVINGITLRHGDLIEGSVDGIVTTGKVNLENDSAWSYFCQNTREGSAPKDKMGYKYGWCFKPHDPSGFKAIRVISSGTQSDSRPFLDVPGVGKLYHGDYIKVKVDAYKPKILFKCKLVYQAGSWYLNNDKIGHVNPLIQKFQYPFHWGFAQISPGKFSQTVTIKELVERGEVEAVAPPPVATISYAQDYPVAKGRPYHPDEAYGAMYGADYAPPKQSSAKPKTTETPVKIVIPRRRLLRLNQDL